LMKSEKPHEIRWEYYFSEIGKSLLSIFGCRVFWVFPLRRSIRFERTILMANFSWMTFTTVDEIENERWCPPGE
jgi:hypothetical protein